MRNRVFVRYRAFKTTTAEGVETKEHLDRVRAEGCTEVHGYYISRPKPSLLLTHAEKSANAAQRTAAM
jgi:EAL domain-containing protein (putative c-di-GMP-specific phosphodiesterase class I)